MNGRPFSYELYEAAGQEVARALCSFEVDQGKSRLITPLGKSIWQVRSLAVGHR
jgi:hypothetical protein